jgi:hypothetical protein
MTDFQTSDRDVNRAIRSWLHEDRHEDASRIAGAVLDQVEATPQRRAGWPAWRTPTMNRFITFGLGAAAVVALAVVALRLAGESNTGGPGTTPTPQASATPVASSEPSATADGSLPVGTDHVLWDATDAFGMRITVPIPAAGWFVGPGEGILLKNDSADAPDGASVSVFARTNGLLVGLGDIYVYGDPCHWASTTPDAPVRTVDEAMAALSAQPGRNASAPVDVIYDGYSGQYITLHVPDDADFRDCDEGEFRTLVQSDGPTSALSHEAPGQLDLLTILDVNGQLVIFDVSYFEGADGTPEAVFDEIAAIVTGADIQYAP